jgi:zinc protease
MKLLLVLLALISTAKAQFNISEWQTPEGAKVLFTQTKGLPMLDISAVFDAASSRDKSQHGIAKLTNTLIGTATNSLNEEQIINKFELLGSEFSTTSLKDMAIISMRSLTRDKILQQSVSLFSEVLAKVDFKQSYLSREKKQIYQSIESINQNPGQIAKLKFDELVFNNHTYAHATIGTKQTIKAIRLSDIEQFYQKYYVAKNLTIALVGDISETYARQIARQISHGLNIWQKPKPNPKVAKLSKSAKVHINFPSQQTHLLIGQTGINRDNADYYALYLGNHILGGSGLTSILNDEIREQRGLAYSVASYFSKMKSDGKFLIKLQTKNSQANEAKEIVLATLKDFINNPISTQKLQDGKDNIIGGFSLGLASNANIITYLAIIGFYDLPLDFLKTFISKIEPISAFDIKQAYARLINMDKLIILSVGSQE